MSEAIIKAVLGGRLKVGSPEPVEIALYDLLMEDRGLSNSKYASRVRELLRKTLIARIIREERLMAAAYATRSEYVPLSLADALRELLRIRGDSGCLTGGPLSASS